MASTAGYSARQNIFLVECDWFNPINPPDQENCTNHLITEFFIYGISNMQEIPPTVEEHPFNFVFDPEKHYFLEFQSGTSRWQSNTYRGGVSLDDTYDSGSCFHFNGWRRELSPCISAGDGFPVADIPFLIEGAERISDTSSDIGPDGTPILFLPGILGSRLYVVEPDGNLDKAWEALPGEEMRRLAMNEEGESMQDIQVGSAIYTFGFGPKWIARGSRDIYQSLRDYFQCDVRDGIFKSALIEGIPGHDADRLNCKNPFITYPYDWRYDVFDVVDNGTTFTSGENIKLIDLVERLAQNPSGKVHILAHSNGGLLAKALMVRLEERGKEDLIDKVIVVGSPQYGTPKTIGAMLHGYDKAILLGLFKDAKVSRTLSRNTPGTYGLLPSAALINSFESMITFDDSPAARPYYNQFGGDIDSAQEMQDFLLDRFNLRDQPRESDLQTPAILNEALLVQAQQTHSILDSWAPPEDVEFIQIIGVGNKTPKGFQYSSKRKPTQLGTGSLVFHNLYGLRYEPLFFNDGDRDVIAAASETGFEEAFYFDLRNLDLLTQREKNHTNIFTEIELLNSIEELVEDNNVSSIFLSQTKPKYETEDVLVVSIHSPVEISITNSKGNTTNITYDTETSLFESTEGMPSSSVEMIGEGKYIFLPAGEYNVSINGIHSGSFDLRLSQVTQEGEIVPVQEVLRVPVQKDSSATASISSNDIGTISLDLDNDSVTDYTFSSNDTDSISTIAQTLEQDLLELPLRPQLKNAIEQYFEIWETSEDSDERTNTMAQIQRIIGFLADRYISQDTATTWTALTNHLQY